jgi:polyphosphate kinase
MPGMDVRMLTACATAAKTSGAPVTGTVTLQATFVNEDNMLWARLARHTSRCSASSAYGGNVGR